MQILKPGKAIHHDMICKFCNCEFRYGWEDVDIMNIPPSYSIHYVECPCCGMKHEISQDTIFFEREETSNVDQT